MTKAAILKRIWANSYARFAVLAAILVTVISSITGVVKGLETVSDVFAWAQWTYVRLNTPWIGLFMLVMVGAILWIGIERLIKADNEREALYAGTQKQAVEIPVLMTKSHIMWKELLAFQERVDGIKI